MLRRSLALALPLALLLVVAVMPSTGCKTETTTVPGDPCKGGFLREETGLCEALCDEAQCLEGNRCVDNRCSLLCETQDDCPPKQVCDDSGNCHVVTQQCAESTSDLDGTPLRACMPVSVALSPVGPGYKCPLGWECFQHYCPFDAQTGTAQKCDPFACNSNPSACVDGVCSDTGDPCVGMPCGAQDCKPSLFCPNGLQCDPYACGGVPHNCVRDCPGDGPCNVGKCAGTDEFCVYTDPESCPACKVMTCVSVGEGDANAYCATSDCALAAQTPEDDPEAEPLEACAPGFYCGNVRDPHDICGPTCGGTCNGGPIAGSTCSSDSQCQKGNDATCGTTMEECISPEQTNPQFGATFFEGPRCLMRSACLKRDTCAPCENNIDCSLGNGDVCISLFEDLVCARFCGVDSDCRPDHWCAEFIGLSGKTGTCATATTIECADADECPNGEACVPRSICIPKGGPCRADPSLPPEQRFCQHCVDDTDCAAPGDPGQWACLQVTNGEHACIDTALPWPCTVDSDCPASPGGAFGECLDEGEGVQPSSSAYHRCYFPFSAANGRFTCFP
jgi:hypothetical protein